MVENESNFGFARLAAATMVMLHHSYVLTGTGGGPAVASFAVPIFFVISGYLICQSWQADPDLPRYIARRVLRIFPALVVLVLVSACVLGPLLTSLPLDSYFQNNNFFLYFYNIGLAPHFALPGVFDLNPWGSAVNGSLWTIPIEFLMYLTLPIFGSRSHMARKFILPSVLIIGVAVGIFVKTAMPSQIYPVVYFTSIPSVLKLAPYFLVGAAIRALRFERFLNLQAAGVLLVLLGCIGSTVIFYAAEFVIIPYAVLSFCLIKLPVFRKFDAMTDISYGVYLWAFPIQQTLIHIFKGISPLALFAAAMTLTYAIAYGSARIVEMPIMRLKPRRPRVSQDAIARGESCADGRQGLQTSQRDPAVPLRTPTAP